MKFNVQDVKGFKELIYPRGAYEAKITGAEEKVAKSGRLFYKLELTVNETIPAGLEIDPEEFRNPLGKKIFKNVFLEMEGDKPGYVGMCKKALRDLINYANIDLQSDDGMDADELLNQYVGITIGHEKINRDDPNSDMKAEVSGFCELPEA